MASYRGLSLREMKVIDEYFRNNGNKTDALRKLNYSDPEDYSTVFFTRPTVIAEVERRRKQIETKFAVDRDWIVSQYVKIIMANEKKSKYVKINDDGSISYDFTKAPPEDLAILNDTVEISAEGDKRSRRHKVVSTDVKGALDSLAKILGLFVDKKEISGPDGGPVEILSDKELARRLAFILAKGEQATEGEEG